MADTRPAPSSETAQAAPDAESELDSAIELLRVSIPPADARAPIDGEPTDGVSPTGTMSPEAIDSVARFISDPGLVARSTHRELDAPRRSLQVLELLEGAEEGAEPTDMRAPPQPPPPPSKFRGVDAPQGNQELPSIVLGAQMSTRADPTERTRTIPATHPLANSIAPGGSAVSTPPRPRRNGRWQVALGVAALIAIGFSTRYLQSRGEHHAASGLPAERSEDESVVHRDEQAARVTEQELIARQVAEVESAREAEQQAELARLAEAAAESAAARSSQKQEANKRQAEEAEKSRAKAVAEKGAAKKARSMRIAFGDPRMFDREQAEQEGGPDRAKVIAAMSAMTQQLKDCVGGEHGVADVTLTVRATGVVSHALVEGAFADSPQGTCIARTLRTAKLPPFAEPVTRIEYPFQL